MSRLARAIEILEVINEYFQKGADSLHADALLLEDGARIKDAIADCLGDVENSEPVFVIPRSQRRHYGLNVLGHWVGFVGKSKIKAHDFGVGQAAKERAIAWVNEQ